MPIHVRVVCDGVCCVCLQAEAEDAEFPDEIDTPQDMAARVRFAKYRCVRRCIFVWLQGCTLWAYLAQHVLSCALSFHHSASLSHPASVSLSPSLPPFLPPINRGLKSFRSSPWDAREGLPAEYGRVFAFENFKRTAKRAREAAVSCHMLLLLRRRRLLFQGCCCNSTV